MISQFHAAKIFTPYAKALFDRAAGLGIKRILNITTALICSFCSVCNHLTSQLINKSTSKTSALFPRQWTCRHILKRFACVVCSLICILPCVFIIFRLDIFIAVLYLLFAKMNVSFVWMCSLIVLLNVHFSVQLFELKCLGKIFMYLYFNTAKINYFCLRFSHVLINFFDYFIFISFVKFFSSDACVIIILI